MLSELSLVLVENKNAHSVKLSAQKKYLKTCDKLFKESVLFFLSIYPVGIFIHILNIPNESVQEGLSLHGYSSV